MSSAAPAHVSLFGDSHGAVFVEKLIVYTPLMLLFFLGFQLAEASTAQLVVRRASSAAARAAVVVLPDDPAFYNGVATHAFEGQRRDDVYLAAAMVLAASPQVSGDFEVTVGEPPVEDFGPVDVTVSATYHCGGLSLLCGPDGTLALSATTRHAYHRAEYTYDTFAGFDGAVVGGAGNGTEELGTTVTALGTSSTASGAGASASSNGKLLKVINQLCSCPRMRFATPAKQRKADAKCIAQAVTGELNATLPATFTISPSREPKLSSLVRNFISTFIGDNVGDQTTRRKLQSDLMLARTTDLLSILNIIKSAVDASGAEVKGRSEGKVEIQTVYRLDRRAPEANGWSNVSYMEPNSRQTFSAEPWAHYNAQSAGTASYVSATGIIYSGEVPPGGLENANAYLGTNKYFNDPAFLCVQRKKDTFVSVACSTKGTLEISVANQYKANDVPVYVPRVHPNPYEREVLCLALKPSSYKKIVYVHHSEWGAEYMLTKEVKFN